MCSTPESLRSRSAGHPASRRVLAPLVLLVAAVGGCAQKPPQTYAPPPLIVDGAMQRREWERSVAYYPNGDTVSGNSRFPLRSDVNPGENEYGAAAYDIAASLAQTVALPFTYIFIPPFAPAVYHGEVIGPSYNAMPPMRPPSPVVNVDGVLVDRDTLEVRQAPKQAQDERYRHYGPMGPGDTDFESSQPVPAREWE